MLVIDVFHWKHFDKKSFLEIKEYLRYSESGYDRRKRNVQQTPLVTNKLKVMLLVFILNSITGNESLKSRVPNELIIDVTYYYNGISVKSGQKDFAILNAHLTLYK